MVKLKNGPFFATSGEKTYSGPKYDPGFKRTDDFVEKNKKPKCVGDIPIPCIDLIFKPFETIPIPDKCAAFVGYNSFYITNGKIYVSEITLPNFDLIGGRKNTKKYIKLHPERVFNRIEKRIRHQLKDTEYENLPIEFEDSKLIE